MLRGDDGLVGAARKIGADADELYGDLSQASEEIRSFVASQIEQRPYLTLGVAAALGYVLGGGLPRYAVSLVGAVGLRAALDRFLGSLTSGNEHGTRGGASDGPEWH
jgi:hypothetical protein